MCLQEERQLPASASAMLENLPGWEWSALRTSHYNLKQSVLPSSLVLAAGAKSFISRRFSVDFGLIYGGK